MDNILIIGIAIIETGNCLVKRIVRNIFNEHRICFEQERDSSEPGAPPVMALLFPHKHAAGRCRSLEARWRCPESNRDLAVRSYPLSR
jgi:hypothetical protein